MPTTPTTDRGDRWRADQAEIAQRTADEAAARQRPVYTDVATYLSAHPDGAPYVACAGSRPAVLLPVLHPSRWGHLPGGYLLAMCVSALDGHTHWVGVYDQDDGAWIHPCADAAEGQAMLETLTLLAPLDPSDLVSALGFTPD